MPAHILLLALSICAVWLPPLRLGRELQLPLWPAFYAGAVLVAWHQDFVQVSGVLALAALVGLAFAVRRTEGWQHGLAFVLLVVLSAALALHKVPGFNNPVNMAMQFSPDAEPFIQYLNFDKGSVGLVLVAFLAPGRRTDGRIRLAREALLACLAVSVVVLGLAMGIGVVRFDPKLPATTLDFLFVNLFLTCVAEEALFRLLIQDPLQGAARERRRVILAVVVSGLLFGLAHAAGGPSMVVLAMLAGLGYAIAYAKTGRIQVAILVHSALNATHFLLFSYPALRTA
jgi:membrane protease YdiL (CAAX protease family)